MFKIAGSFGPAGSLLTLFERVIRYAYPEAYYVEAPEVAVRRQYDSKIEADKTAFIK